MFSRLPLQVRHARFSERALTVFCQMLLARLIVLLVCLVVILSYTQDSFAQKKEVFQESQVKSVFLYNLTKFITWPSDQKSTSNSKFFIGILGVHNFNEILEKVVENEKVSDRDIQLAFWDSIEDVNWSTLDMLFVGKDSFKDFEIIREKCRVNKILTVGDSEGFCQLGGMVNLLTDNRRMKLEVNVDEVAGSGFMISGSVLKLATIVRSDVQKK